MSEDYNKDLEIDFHRLDENWRDHSMNYMQWSEKWVNAVAARDRAKEQLDLIKAELDQKIRFEAKTKLTESAISSMITTHSDYQTAAERLHACNEEVNLYVMAKSAFEHRKVALEGLTKLWVSGYWSEPKIVGEVKDQVQTEKMQRKLNENERLQKRKKS
jgi:hypothetical protein